LQFSLQAASPETFGYTLVSHTVTGPSRKIEIVSRYQAVPTARAMTGCQMVTDTGTEAVNCGIPLTAPCWHSAGISFEAHWLLAEYNFL
jgi:hypothetical protein